MIAESIIFMIVLIALIIGSYTDFKVREVPDWLNYGLIFLGFGLRMIFSLGYKDFSFFIDGVLGFVAFFLIALFMFYAGQWGGGDSKMLMGLGVLLGLDLGQYSVLAFSVILVLTAIISAILVAYYLSSGLKRRIDSSMSKFERSYDAGGWVRLLSQAIFSIMAISLVVFIFLSAFDSFLIALVINIIIFGALFGLLFSVYLAVVNFKSLKKEFSRQFKERKKVKWFVWIGTLSLLGLSIFAPFSVKVPIVVLAGMMFASFYVLVYLKSLEKAAMIKAVEPDVLTEGDWVVKDIFVDGKKICGPGDLGLEKRQISKLIALRNKKKIGKVLVKYGIPFVPGFLTAFIVTYFWGNFVLVFLGF